MIKKTNGFDILYYVSLVAFLASIFLALRLDVGPKYFALVFAAPLEMAVLANVFNGIFCQKMQGRCGSIYKSETPKEFSMCQKASVAIAIIIPGAAIAVTVFR